MESVWSRIQIGERMGRKAADRASYICPSTLGEVGCTGRGEVGRSEDG